MDINFVGPTEREKEREEKKRDYEKLMLRLFHSNMHSMLKGIS